jgi:hypothetical protein
VRSWRGLVLALLLAVGPVTGAPPRCREVPAADARRRLAVGGREWAGARGPITARASRRGAVLAGGDGAVLEALVLMALDDAHGPVETPPRRPR